MTGKELLTTAEAAPMFGVDPKTLLRWERSGKVPCIRTLGGHRRFRRTDIDALLTRLSTADGWKPAGPPQQKS